MISRVRQVLGVEVALARRCSSAPALAELARADRERGAGPSCPPIERGRRAAGALPLSFAQQRLWFLEQLGGLGDAYHIARGAAAGGASWTAAALRARAGPDRGAARGAAHDLRGGRTASRCSGSRRRTSRLRLVEHDLRGAPGRRGGAARGWRPRRRPRPSTWRAGPLIRGRLVRLAADEHVLLVTMHHIVSDGWSHGGAHPRAGRALRRLPPRRARSAPRRCRCSTPTTRRGSGSGWRARCCGSRRSTGRRRSAARRRCWSCPPTVRARRGRTHAGAIAAAGAGRGADRGR